MADDNTKHKRHRTRLRASALPYPDDLSAEKLLELLLFELIPQSDTADLAKSLMKDGGLTGALNPPQPAGTPTAQFLHTLGAVCRRYERRSEEEAGRFPTLYEARRWLCEMVSRENAEGVCVLALGANLALQRLSWVPGGVEIPGSPALQLLDNALGANCAFVFVAFGHPAGLLVPSHAEMNAVTALLRQCRKQGARAADVLFVTRDGARGLSETQHFPPGTFLDFKRSWQVKE